MTNAFIFLDNSNIFLSGRSIAELRDGMGAKGPFRLQLDNLIELAAAGRTIGGAWASGSTDSDRSSPVWKTLRDRGVRVEVYERGAYTGGEQAVDQSLQVHLLRLGYQDPQVAVLLTGDGSGHEGGTGFLNDAKLLASNGWAVEVLSWRHSCSAALRAWAEEHGVFVALDDYYDQVTFLEFGRLSKPLSMVRRAKAVPGKSLRERVSEDVTRAAAADIAALNDQLNKLKRKVAKSDRYNAKMAKRNASAGK